ncbi:hypothetical protein BDV25DRAFT_143376 [Aspergillus avenaceus]|uniref:Uncharacterized protein n=1 Tax=Aspergillus avenaceus TaxID=36643 RepID=A0A5N6TKG0_ASPAV|nr:hypothetical protein BDV25DRAFT_143376 [Aspergillus avenaceus]
MAIAAPQEADDDYAVEDASKCRHGYEKCMERCRHHDEGKKKCFKACHEKYCK